MSTKKLLSSRIYVWDIPKLNAKCSPSIMTRPDCKNQCITLTNASRARVFIKTEKYATLNGTIQVHQTVENTPGFIIMSEHASPNLAAAATSTAPTNAVPSALGQNTGQNPGAVSPNTGTASGSETSTAMVALPNDAPPSSQNMIGNYMVTVGLYSGLVILGLLTFLWFIKNRPQFAQRIRQLLGAKAPAAAPAAKMKVEEMLPIDADKTLMIVRCEGERFLVSSAAEGLRFMTKLDDGQNHASLLQYLMAQQQQAPQAHSASLYPSPLSGHAGGADPFVGAGMAPGTAVPGSPAFTLEHGTIEDASGIRGQAITPTETGVTELPSPSGKQFSNAFQHTLRDMLQNVSSITRPKR
jgi:hypothetical protein